MNTKIIKLDINKELYTIANAKQGDTKSRFLLFNLYDNSIPFSLVNKSVRAYAKKPDGLELFNDLKIINATSGSCELELTNQLLSTPGIVKVELMILEGEKKLTSIPFQLKVIESINSEKAVISTNEFSALVNALNKADEYNKELQAASEGLEFKYAEKLNGLGSQLAENYKTKNNTDNYLPSSNISPKLIYKLDGVTYIVTQKPNGNGYIRVSMKEGVVTSDSSVGGNAQLLRLVEVRNVLKCFVLKNIPSANSGANWETKTLPYETHTALISYGLKSASVNDWVEYQITVPQGIYSTRMLAYQSSGSSNNVDIYVDGVIVLNGVSLQGTNGWKEVEIPLNPGSHTVKIESKSNGFLTIGGVNMMNLNEFKNGTSYDDGVIYYVNANPYITNAGAVDYALFDSDLNLWCGSYHGGETRSRFSMILDNTILSLENNDYHVGRVLEIEQDTLINNKINAYSRYIFRLDGVQEFEVCFEGDINVSKLFTNMTTTHNDYTDVIYPKKMNSTNDGTYYLPIGSNYVIQKNPNNNQKITTIMNDNILPEGSISIPYISASIYYKKLYKDNLNGKVYNLKNGHFKSAHIFE